MNDEEYKRIKDYIEKEIPIKNELSDFRWDISFLTLIKDKNNKKAFVDLIENIEIRMRNQTFDKIMDFISKDYIEIGDIPSAEDLFGIIEDRIKSNQEMIEFCKKESIKHIKAKDKEKDYNKLKQLESDIFWDEHSLEGYKKEIFFYEHIRDCLKADIRGLKYRKEDGSEHG